MAVLANQKLLQFPKWYEIPGVCSVLMEVVDQEKMNFLFIDFF